MIRSFHDNETERVWLRQRSRRFPPDILHRAVNRLRLLDAAETLDDVRFPPGNRLHALTDDRTGQHSISINMQWRVCFVWRDGGAERVEITDYH
ncbi:MULTISPECIES: type II toxin-antitoxin system RelE/ParE family toxin [Sphingomonas]|uniref:type II toxin-antitoxin system RelE/ParE family toxin n=1 Tax=Sphingomonas TaxID=13687 RepID=UPI0020BED475|nr:type II toxin-antitoxin system RelE/ParE family toxin [Sphingomonas faeni]MCK8456793.1 type II toxin-antitoxin system RelE/ParE family toxin [Sphingomonas faeni]